ncbi:MAG: nitroreductase [Alphaproteobacteria bacterium]|nr:nitroreductase [Alphaproteobacteria bacterium]
MFNDTHTPLSLLLSRRSGKPRDMVAPGPDAEQMATILSAASRVPDHGKLAPWRFVTVATDQRDTLADLLVTAYRAEKPEAGKLELDAMVQFAQQAPALVVVLSSPVSSSKIPLWEQELSVGAACMQLLNAAHALGFVGGWLTGWPTYSNHVRDAFGGVDERIAGFIFIGSPSKALEERPRPNLSDVVRAWQP